MSAATKAKSARARATIAGRLLKTTKRWPFGNGLGRDFDDCFEMYDGKAVVYYLARDAASDPLLLAAMHYHGLNTIAADAEALKAEEETRQKEFANETEREVHSDHAG